MAPRLGTSPRHAEGVDKIYSRTGTTRPGLSKMAGAGGQVLKSNTADPRRMALFGDALSLAVLTTAGGYAFLSSKEGAPTISASDAAGHANKPKLSLSPGRIHTVRMAVQDHLSRLNSNCEQGTLVEYYSIRRSPFSGLTTTALPTGRRRLYKRWPRRRSMASKQPIISCQTGTALAAIVRSTAWPTPRSKSAWPYFATR